MKINGQIFERWGLFHINRYLRIKSISISQLSIQTITIIAVSLSFIIGFTLTFLVVLADINLFYDLHEVLSSSKLLFSLIAINVILVGIEFWLLFHLGFYTIAQYIVRLSQQMDGQNSVFLVTHHYFNQTIKASLVRAVLELNEPMIQRFGLNPYRNKAKHYWLKLILYKMKVILSNALGKLIARKLLSRLGLRSYAPLVATIITGWWDAWIQHSVLREVRFRLAGRLYVLHLLESLNSEQEQSNFLETMTRILAVRIEYYGSYHINLDYLIVELDQMHSGSVTDYFELFDIAQLKHSYKKLSQAEQLRSAQVACYLLAFKHSRLNNQELSLMSVFNLSGSAINRARKDFNQLRIPQ